MTQNNQYASPKSSMLWNIIDPSDPYDIRKSMIARLPEHTQNFMGGNVEIVCLMQAAQIERLNEFLAEYQLKYREVERQHLDRHYYQVQIKQLSEKASEVTKFRTENEKLRAFIKSQSQQLEQMTRKPSVPESLQGQHEQLLQKYQSLLIELQSSRESTQSMNLTIMKLTEELKQFRIKYDRLDKQRLTEITQEREKYELKIQERIQIQIKEVDYRWSSRVSQLESESRYYKQQLQTKNLQISSLSNRIESLKRQLQSKQKQKSINPQMQLKMRDLEQINITLLRKAGELEKIYEQHTRMQSSLRQLERAYHRERQQNNRLRQQVERLRTSANKNFKDVQAWEQLQNKVALLSSEVQRLTFLSDNKSHQISQSQSRYNTQRIQYETRIRKLTSDLQMQVVSRRQYDQRTSGLNSELNSLRAMTLDLKLKNQLLQKQNANSKRTIELEDQIRRLNGVLITKNDQLNSLELRIKTIEGSSSVEVVSLKKVIAEKERIFAGLDSQIKNYELTIRNLKAQLTNKEELRRQLEKQVFVSHQLKSNYQTTKNQLAQIKRSVQQYQINIKKGNLVSRGFVDEEIRKAIQEYRRRVQIDHERQTAKIHEQIIKYERISSETTQRNRLLQQQITILQDKLNKKQRQAQQNAAAIDVSFRNQLQTLSTTVKFLKEQCDKVNIEKNRQKIMISDLERQLQNKDKQTGDFNRRIQDMHLQNQELNRQNARLRQEISSIQDRSIKINRQTQEKTIRIYTVQLQDKDNIIQSLERQIKASRQEIIHLQETYEGSNATLKNYRSRLLMTSQQIERLNELLQSKNNQLDSLSEMQSNFKRQILDKSDQITRLSQRVSQLESNLQIQFQRKEVQQREHYKSAAEASQNVHRTQISERDRQISQLRLQLQSGDQNLKRQLAQKENALALTSSQITRLNEIIKSFNQDNSKEYDKFQETLRNKQNQCEKLRRELQTRRDGDQRIKVEFESTINGLRNNEAKLSLQRDNLKNEIILLRREIQTKHSSVTIIQKQKESFIMRIRELEQAIIQSQSTQSPKEAQLEKVIREKQTEILNLRRAISELEGKNSKNTQEIGFLQQAMAQDRRQIDRLKQSMRDTNINQVQYNQISVRYNEMTVICSQYQDKIRKYQANMVEISRRCQQYQAQFNNLLTEMDKVKLTIQEKEDDLDKCKIYIQELKVVIENQSQDNTKILRAYNQLQITNNHVIGQNKQLLTIIDKLQTNEKSLVAYINEQNNERAKLQTDQSRITQLQNEIRNLRSIYATLQQTHLHTIAERDQLFNLCHRYKSDLDSLSLSTTKITELTTLYSQSQQKVQRYGISIQNLTRSNRELQLKLNETLNEVSRLTTMIQQRDGQNKLINELTSKLSALSDQYNIKCEQSKMWQQKYVQLYQKYVSDSDKIKHSVLDYQNKIKRFDQEFNNLQVLIQTLKQENEQLRRQLSESGNHIQNNKVLSLEVDRLNQVVRQLKQELSDTRLRLIDQMSLQKRLEECLALMVILFAEIETLRNRVTDTEKQCENVRRSSLTPHRVDRQVGRSVDIKGVQVNI